MAKKKTKRIKPRLKKPILDDSGIRVLAMNKPYMTKELLNKIPWLKDRYLLPGESAEDYDLRLQALVNSIEIHNTLDAILVKDIHDEMREMHRLRILKNTFIVDGMRYHLNKEIGGQIYYSNKGDVSPEIFDLVTRWQNGDESVGQPFLALIRKAGLTLAELQLRAFESNCRHLIMVDDLMARHQKNIKESFKLIDMRHNNALVRQRIEQEMERLSANLLVVEHDES